MALTKSLSFSYGRKRILISNDSHNFEDFSANFEPLKHTYLEKEDEIRFNCTNSSSSSPLESLPQEILIKVICCVDHNDLKHLFHVSKTVRDATLIAKQSHFAYSTPSKTRGFKNSIDSMNNPRNLDMDYKAPNAPKQSKRGNRPQICRKKLEDISVALFANYDQSQSRPRRSLFMETEN
ncbi:hypothetical protein Cgig2_024230 [Carnegiea gigantea]|uniref:F-box domain-containing protein n=1 Tax=Carnegiea gigantea TaxID=171969 RepID=A0A9Q1Q9N4_9CARY|nr:hypothetical protein Cgig2_024230 [Carnegiea gigantea]